MVSIQKIRPKAQTHLVSIRISKHLKNWIDNKQYSQTKIFVHACKVLGYKEDKE